MKHFGPFSWVLCLLIALGVLFSGFGFLDAGKVCSQSVAADEETFEGVEEEDLLEDSDILSALFGLDAAGAIPASAAFYTFSVADDRAVPVQPSGWLMPVRI